MKSDFSKIKFDKDKHYSKVNIQQGSILLDSDLNEASDIQNYHHRTSLKDVIGKCGVPAENPGFEIIGNSEALFAWENITVEDNPDNETLRDFIRNNFDARWLDDDLKRPPHELFTKSTDGKTISAASGNRGNDIDIVLNDDNTAASLSVDKIKKFDFIVKFGQDEKTHLHSKWFQIGAGHCYTDGILVQNEAKIDGSRQPDLPVPYPYNVTDNPDLPLADFGLYLVYLRVWERLITPLQDPEITEKAVGDANTTTRAKVIWQVWLTRVPDETRCSSSPVEAWDNIIQPSSCKLRARSKPTMPTNEPCQLPPGAGYRGLENQLYRIEIHDPGVVGSGAATFKWSRENGARYAKVLGFSPGQLTISSTGTDLRLGFATNDLIEVSSDKHELWGLPGTLAKIKEVKDDNTLILDETSIDGDDLTDQNFPQEFNPLVRRWDCSQLIPVNIPSGPDTEGYIELEEGVQIRFDADGTCKTGDFWTVPARTATADVDWPKIDNNNKNSTPVSKLPEGIKYHYCRLAVINYDKATGTITVNEDCRHIFPPITESRQGTAMAATTGIIRAHFPQEVVEPGRAYFFGPFNHFLRDLENPPAIILGLANMEALETRVRFMEDYAAVQDVPDPANPSGMLPPYQLKAVNIGLQKFLVSISFPIRTTIGDHRIPIRWYAIPAQQKSEQESDISLGISFTDKDLNPIEVIPHNTPPSDNPFKIRVLDQVIRLESPSTEEINVHIIIQNSKVGRFRVLVPFRRLETGVFIVDLNNTERGLIIRDGIHDNNPIRTDSDNNNDLFVEYTHGYGWPTSRVSKFVRFTGIMPAGT